MLKNEFMHSNLKVRSACKRLIHAVNDNPYALNDLEICSIKKGHKNNSQLRDIGFFSIMLLAISKFAGWH